MDQCLSAPSVDANGNAKPRLWMYGGFLGPDHEAASKAAGKEMKTLEYMFHVINMRKRLSIPLMSIIDFCGFRVLCTSLLPISGAASIKYGSSDGGQTVHNDDRQLNLIMKDLFESFGLTSHLVKGKAIHGPGDIEVHLGKDDMFYLLDVARVSPPEAPSSDPARRRSEPRAVFYKLLRMELVRRFFQETGTALCSDTFTGWDMGDPKRLEHQRDVRNATMWLMDTAIPQFAKEWESSVFCQEYVLLSKTCDSSSTSCAQSAPLATMLALRTSLLRSFCGQVHHAGINFRHLGRLRSHCSLDVVRTLILEICVARALKNHLRAAFRKAKQSQSHSSPSISPYVHLAQAKMNLLFSFAEDSVRFWSDCQGFKAGLNRHFPQLLTETEMEDGFDVRRDLDLLSIFRIFADLVGVRLVGESALLDALHSCVLHNADARALIATGDKAAMLKSFEVLPRDFSVWPRVRRLSCVVMFAGKLNINNLPFVTSEDKKKRILSESHELLETAIGYSSTCPATTLMYAKCLAHMAALKVDGRCSESMFIRSYEQFLNSCRLAWDFGFTKKFFDYAVDVWVEAIDMHCELKKRSSGGVPLATLQRRRKAVKRALANIEWEEASPSPFVSPCDWSAGLKPSGIFRFDINL
eukprot:TRINITY_DN10129_c0_g2_i1.p1 TRINITY_DN10129_c0_g2~~TRINITY_DN10129_c0_g2_i1.p1  ORF type:complete len:639 (-),score=81.39 TRINITY_DN10129_c0_g2_i1:33-1949(-)